MPTPPRIAYAGAYYHLVSRGNNKLEIFLDDTDRLEYLGTLSRLAKKFRLKIYAYVLMSNHVHLLLETLEANISVAMHEINLAYSRYFNSKHGHTGHLFETRFKSRLLQKERYFLAVLRYIHLNPVKAGMVARPEDYRWSSHTGYLLGGDSFINPPDEVLSSFSERPEMAKFAYAEFIMAPISPKEWSKLDKFRNGVLGDEAFMLKR